MFLFKDLPKMIVLSIMLIKALDLRISLKLIQDIVYLWREFFIKVRIVPKIESFKVGFIYKDVTLTYVEVKDLKDLFKIIEDLKKIRSI